MEEHTLQEAIESWKSREQLLERMFSGKLLSSPRFLQEKLRHYRQLDNQFRWQPGMKKDLTLKMLREEVRGLERMLYPNFMERITRRLASMARSYFGSQRLLAQEQARLSRLRESREIEKLLQDNKLQSMVQSTKKRPALTQKGKGQASVPESKIVVMPDRNYERLCQQLRQLGFGDSLRTALKEKMQQKDLQFDLTLPKNYGKDETVTTLNYRRSEEGMYTLLRYSMSLKSDRYVVPLQHTFYAGNKDATITATEAYHLLAGRAVHKEVANQQGEKYNAWLQLDFKTPNGSHGYRVRSFTENYGYDLKGTLEKYPIKEIQDNVSAGKLVEALQKGERQPVTLEIGGATEKVWVEAAPQFKTINMYAVSGERLRMDQVRERMVSKNESVKESQQRGQKAGAVDGGGEMETGTKKKKGKRKGQRLI